MYAKIQTVSVNLPPVACDALKISNVTCNALGLDGQATIQWAVTGEAAGAYQGGSLSLDGAAYAAWGSDDEYLYRFTATAIGVTITEIVPDAVAASPVASPAPVEAPVVPLAVEEPALAPVVVEEPVEAPVVVEEPAAAPLEADPAAGSI